MTFAFNNKSTRRMWPNWFRCKFQFFSLVGNDRNRCQAWKLPHRGHYYRSDWETE